MGRVIDHVLMCSAKILQILDGGLEIETIYKIRA